MANFKTIVRRLESLAGLDRTARPLADQAGRITGRTPVKNFLSGTWLGHPVHPVLTDLPIGAWAMATLLDITGGRASSKAARRLVGMGVLVAIPTAATGTSDWADTYGADQRVGLVHGLGNAAAVCLQIVSYLGRKRGHRAIGAALSSVSLGLVMATGYLGGHLSFGRGIGVNHTAFEEQAIDWVDVASFQDLASMAKPMRVVVNGTPVMLIRDNDHVVALSATCVHAGGPLDEGTIIDGSVRCPWHRSIFRLADGKALRGPASMPQPVWEARIEDGRVQVRSDTSR